MARISVALATYNGERFLKEQLESLAAQRVLPLELHAGDDGSTDGTLDLLEAFAHRAPFPVFIHRNPQRLNVSANFMATASRCAGDWIAFCDQDDVWMPDKLSAMSAAIERSSPAVALAVHNAVITDADLNPLYLKTHWSGTSEMKRLTLPPHWSAAGFSQIFHRRLIDSMPPEGKQGGRRSDDWNSHDRWIPALAMATGSVLLVGEPLAFYRRHGTNVSPGDRLKPASRAGWLARALGNNEAAYAEQVPETRWVAELLRESAEDAFDAVMAGQLRDAADRIAYYADLLGHRAAAYKARHLRDRLRQIRHLHGAGGYARSRVCSFGPRALVKDLAYAAIPFGRS